MGGGYPERHLPATAPSVSSTVNGHPVRRGSPRRPGASSEPVLGVSADYHDSAAALVIDGSVVAAAAEERFSRTKHDPSMPVQAIAWCLESQGIAPRELAAVAFAGKPFTTYERILTTHAHVGPRGFPSLMRAVSAWSSRKLWVRYRLDRLLSTLGQPHVPVTFVEHHQAHAAAAYYPSPFDRAAVLTLDGVGEWTTASIARGREGHLDLLDEMRFPDSLGLFYSTMTAYCGFDVNDGEYKLMGLAPYGRPRFVDALSQVCRIGPHGDVHLDQRWFDYRAGRRMAHPRLASLLDGPPLSPGAAVTEREADIAASTQAVLEDAVLSIANRAHRQTHETKLCIAGGVALNCVSNARLASEGPFDGVWVQPAAGDDGGSIGAALWAVHQLGGRPRPFAPKPDGMNGAFLGPRFSTTEIKEWLDQAGIPFMMPVDLEESVARSLTAGHLVGWFTGAMEFGPRALGHRSILADPRQSGVASRLNLKVKGREGFRPFAPAVLAEHADSWFDLKADSPYMLTTAALHPDQRVATTGPELERFSDRLAQVRSTIPACTHVDLSSRVQTVDAERNEPFHRLLSAFHEATGCPVLLNTSFNQAGEPIVRSPADAFDCARRIALDVLVLEGCVIRDPASILRP